MLDPSFSQAMADWPATNVVGLPVLEDPQHTTEALEELRNAREPLSWRWTKPVLVRHDDQPQISRIARKCGGEPDQEGSSFPHPVNAVVFAAIALEDWERLQRLFATDPVQEVLFGTFITEAGENRVALEAMARRLDRRTDETCQRHQSELKADKLDK